MEKTLQFLLAVLISLVVTFGGYLLQYTNGETYRPCISCVFPQPQNNDVLSTYLIPLVSSAFSLLVIVFLKFVYRKRSTVALIFRYAAIICMGITIVTVFLALLGRPLVSVDRRPQAESTQQLKDAFTFRDVNFFKKPFTIGN